VWWFNTCPHTYIHTHTHTYMNACAAFVELAFVDCETKAPGACMSGIGERAYISVIITRAWNKILPIERLLAPTRIDSSDIRRLEALHHHVCTYVCIYLSAQAV
jgi:hypothetical protein